jgi:periplasmic protein TonB
MDWLARWRTMTLSVSCLLHLGLVAGLLLGERWRISAAEAPPVLPVELVAAEPEPVEPVEKPRSAPPRRQPTRLPRPIETPLPAPVAPAREPMAPAPSPAMSPPPEPAPPAPSAPVPAEAVSSSLSNDPSGPPAPPAAASGPPPVSVPAVAPGPREGSGLASAPPPPLAAVPAPNLGAESAGSITRHARPQGGYQVRPSYPSAARRLGIQGTTLLKVHVLVDGRVGDVVVQETAGHPDLDHAAADAVRRWRFEPARRGDDPVAMWVMLPVEFRLK